MTMRSLAPAIRAAVTAAAAPPSAVASPSAPAVAPAAPAGDSGLVYAGGSATFDPTGGIRPAPLPAAPAVAPTRTDMANARYGIGWASAPGNAGSYHLGPEPFAPLTRTGAPVVPDSVSPIIPDSFRARTSAPLTFGAWLRSLFARARGGDR